MTKGIWGKIKSSGEKSHERFFESSTPTGIILWLSGVWVERGIWGDMAIQFFMAMIPPTVTVQEHQVTVRKGKPVFYDTHEIKDANREYIYALKNWRGIEQCAMCN